MSANTPAVDAERKIAGAPISWGVRGARLGLPARARPEVDRLLDAYAASGAGVLVLSAGTGAEGYDTRPVLDDDGWTVLLTNLDRLAELAVRRGVRAVLHPHVGTMVETGEEVQQVLEGSWIALCLDTGHLLIGGTDPAELARRARSGSPTCASRM